MIKHIGLILIMLLSLAFITACADEEARKIKEEFITSCALPDIKKSVCRCIYQQIEKKYTNEEIKHINNTWMTDEFANDLFKFTSMCYSK